MNHREHPDYHRDSPSPGHPAVPLELSPDGTWRPVANPADARHVGGNYAGSLRSPEDRVLSAVLELLFADVAHQSAWVPAVFAAARAARLDTYDPYLVRYSEPWL